MTWQRVGISLVAALALATAACGPQGGGGTQGGGPITVGALFDLTGPTSDVGVPYSEGIRDYVKSLNDRGGINGRKIDLVWEDYTYNVARAEQVYSRLKSKSPVGIMGWGTGDTVALRGKITADKLPFMSASYDETLTRPGEAPYNFVVGTSYSQQMRIALKWIAQDAKGHAEVAVFHHDSPFGQSPLEDGRKYIQEKSLDVGYRTYAMPGRATDYVSQLSQAKAQGAKYIVVQNTSGPAAQLAKDVTRGAIEAKVVCLNWCADELFARLAADGAKGVVGVMPFAPVSAAPPGLQEPSRFLKEQGRSLPEKGLHYAQGWYTMGVMVEGIREALKKGEVTGTSLKEALESIGPFKTGDVTPAIDFTASSHAGMPGSQLFQFDGAAWVKLTDVLTP